MEAITHQEAAQGVPNPERDREAWLRWRRDGIGGSDVGAVLGMDPYRSPLDVYNDKIGLTFGPEETPAMRRGRVLEPAVADEYTRATGRRVRRQPPHIHKDFAWIRCTVDRQILADPETSPRGTSLLEIKTAASHVFRKMKLEGLPERYVLQLQHSLAVWGYEWGAFAVLCPDTWELLHFDVETDRELVDQLLDRETAFWKRVTDRTPPEIEAPAPVKLPKVGGSLVKMPGEEWAAAAAALLEARQILDEANQLKASAQARVLLLMDAAGTDVAEGAGIRVYHKEQAGRVTTDYKALLVEHPEIELAKYQRQGQPFKSFRIYEHIDEGV